MSRSDKFELEGIVKKALPGAKFEVEVKISETNIQKILCTISGKLRQNLIHILPEDQVTIEVSTYDLTKGIITWRKK